MALHDLPACIEFVKGMTGFDKLIYIAHSQGTLMFYLNFILNPTYLPKNIDRFVALGSVLTLNHINSPIATFIEYTWFLNLLDDLYIYNIFNLGTEFNRVIHLLCVKLIEN